MNLYEIQKAVLDFLKLNWTATEIREINQDSHPSLPFIECYLKPGETIGLEINGVGERNGVFMINVFTRIGVGVQEGLVYSGMLEELFWHKTFGDLVCENGSMLPYTVEVGVDVTKDMYHHQVVLPFSIIMEY